MATGRNFSMSGIISGHHNLPKYEISLTSDNVEFVASILKMATGRNFSMLGINSGHHYLPTYQILMMSCFSNGHLSLCQILCLYHYPFRSYLKMLNFCRIVVAILKMASGRNFSMSGINSGHQYLPTYQFSMSGINSGHHYLPTYQIVMISDNVEFLRYCGSHFENGDR